MLISIKLQANWTTLGGRVDFTKGLTCYNLTGKYNLSGLACSFIFPIFDMCFT